MRCRRRAISKRHVARRGRQRVEAPTQPPRPWKFTITTLAASGSAHEPPMVVSHAAWRSPAFAKGPPPALPFARCLAIVPAFQERDGRQVIADIAALAIDPSSSTTARDGTAEEAVAAPGRAWSRCRSTSASAARYRPATWRRRRAIRRRDPGRRRRAASSLEIEAARRAAHGERRRPGDRLAFPGERGTGLSLGRRGHRGVRTHHLGDLPRALTDTTSGFRAGNRRGDFALRRPVPARLPRGRGGPHRATAPGCGSSRCPCNARAAGRPLVDHAAALEPTT